MYLQIPIERVRCWELTLGLWVVRPKRQQQVMFDRIFSDKWVTTFFAEIIKMKFAIVLLVVVLVAVAHAGEDSSEEFACDSALAAGADVTKPTITHLNLPASQIALQRLK